MKTEIIEKKKKKYKFYNNLGEFKFFQVTSNLVFYNFIIFVIYSLISLKNGNLIIYNIDILDIVKEIFNLYINHIIYILSLLSFDINFKNIDIYHYIAILPIVYTIIYILIAIYMYKKSKNQKKLAKISMETYKLVSKNKKEIIIKPLKNEEIEYKFFEDNIDDFIQVFELDITKNIICERYKNDKIKVTVKDNLPTQLNIDVYNFKHNKLLIGQYYNTENNLENYYVDIENFQRVSITGTSGGGKSNLMNLILCNLLFNIQKIEKIILIDFKGGIEAKPFYSICKQYNINIVMCTNINELYPVMVEIDKVNIQRQLAIKYKKTMEKIIYIIFDEFAQLGLAKSNNKEEKLKIEKILSIYSTINATGRTQAIYSLTVTQSFLQNSSGITSQNKTNFDTNILLKTDNQESINSVISQDILEENNINPKTLKKGELILKNDDGLNHIKAYLLPDDIKPIFKQVLFNAFKNEKEIKFEKQMDKENKEYIIYKKLSIFEKLKVFVKFILEEIIFGIIFIIILILIIYTWNLLT